MAGETNGKLAEREEQINTVIRHIKEQIKEVEEKGKKVNDLMIKSYWESGQQIQTLTDGLNENEKRAVKAKFLENNVSDSYYQLSTKFVSVFTQEQYEAAVKNNMTVRVMKALTTSNMDAKRRSQLIQQVITRGLSENDIRSIEGTKNTRRAANATKKRREAKEKPPVKLFATALDRANLLNESIGHASDAVGRLAGLSDNERGEAAKVLVLLRDEVDKLDGVIKGFLKFTANFSKAKK